VMSYAFHRCGSRGTSRCERYSKLAMAELRTVG
jgi:hypothetical protein